MISTWPKEVNETIPDIISVLRYMLREREKDILEFNNLQNVFIRGRKVDRIPTSSADVIAGDKIGDFNYDENYIYILPDGVSWKRVGLSTW